MPGFCWTLVFFKNLTVLERVGISFGLSIALVILSITSLNLVFKLPISPLNNFLVLLVISLVPLVIFLATRWKARRAREADSHPD